MAVVDDRTSICEVDIVYRSPRRIVDAGHHFGTRVAGAELRLVREFLQRVVIPEFDLDATIQSASLSGRIRRESFVSTATVALQHIGR